MSKKAALSRQDRVNAGKKKVTAKKDKKAAKVKIVKPYAKDPSELAANVGHNSGEINKALVTLFDDYEALESNKKEIAKAQRDLRAKAKSEFGVQTNVFSDQIRKRKMDADVRAQFEHGVKDLENMIGYQMSMNLIIEGDESEEQEPTYPVSDSQDPDTLEAAMH